MSTCALCQNDRKLASGHILPKFSYRRMKQREGEFLQFSTARPAKGGVRLQDGPKEYLLCRECEQRFSELEDVFARRVNQAAVFDVTCTDGPDRSIRVERFDYKATKLFFMSILWRIAVAKGPRFQSIQIGAEHEERLRTMLLAGQPGQPWEYGCLLTVPLIEDPDTRKSIRPALVVTPLLTPLTRGMRLLQTCMDGLLLEFPFGTAPAMKSFTKKRRFLRSDGSLVVLTKMITAIPYLRDSWLRHMGYLK